MKTLSRETKNLRVMTLSPVKEWIWVMLLSSSLYAPLGGGERVLVPRKG